MAGQKYLTVRNQIFSAFDEDAWLDLDVTTIPDNFQGDIDNVEDFVRVSIVNSQPSIAYGQAFTQVSGQIIIDIFTQAGQGPDRGYVIADALDRLLAARLFQTVTENEIRNTQLGPSTLIQLGNDRDNPSLYRFQYTINFNHYGG